MECSRADTDEGARERSRDPSSLFREWRGRAPLGSQGRRDSCDRLERRRRRRADTETSTHGAPFRRRRFVRRYRRGGCSLWLRAGPSTTSYIPLGGVVETLESRLSPRRPPSNSVVRNSLTRRQQTVGDPLIKGAWDHREFLWLWTLFSPLGRMMCG